MSIEQKIATILEESRDLKQDELENIISETATEEELEENDSDELEENLETDDEGDYSEDLSEDREEDIEISVTDIKEDVAALIDGEDLTEAFKEKAAIIFEAAVLSRVKQEAARLEEAFELRLDEKAETVKEGLVEKVDGYLDYVVEQWMERNEIALESGMRADIVENFMSRLKNLFTEHYIDVPEDKIDILEEYQSEVDELNVRLDEQMAANVELRRLLEEVEARDVVVACAEGLSDTDRDKFLSLAEEVEFDTLETLENKLNTIRESYFQKNDSTKFIAESVVSDTPVLEEEVEYDRSTPQMKAYLSTLDQTK